MNTNEVGVAGLCLYEYVNKELISIFMRHTAPIHPPQVGLLSFPTIILLDWYYVYVISCQDSKKPQATPPG